MKTNEIDVTIKPKEWFEDNGYLHSDYYYSCAAEYVSFKRGEHRDVRVSATTNVFECPINIQIKDLDSCAWCIEETPDSHPQYFI